MYIPLTGATPRT